jgi:hypothetical protein
MFDYYKSLSSSGNKVEGEDLLADLEREIEVYKALETKKLLGEFMGVWASTTPA